MKVADKPLPPTRQTPQNPFARAVSNAAAAWRSKPGCKRTYELLAGSIRALVHRAAECVLRDSRADDVATEVTMRCLDALDKGAIELGKEASYALRAAHNGAVSMLRKTWAVAMPVDEAELGDWLAYKANGADFAACYPSAETLALDEESARRAKEDVAFLLSVIDDAPDAMQELLRARLDGLTTQELVALHVTSAQAPSASPNFAYAKRVRAKLDQRFARAKRYVRLEFAKRDGSKVDDR